MSELQISLIVLGIIVIVVVIAFNWWQDRRVKRKMQDNLPIVDDDPLLNGGQPSETRKEPGFGLDHLGLVSSSNDTEPVIEQGDETEPLQTGKPIEEPDLVAEVVIEIHLPSPVSGTDLLPALKTVRAVGRRPVRVFLQATDGRLLTAIGEETLYLAIHLAVQIANRSGAITAIEWSQVWGNAQSLAEQLDATVDGPEQNDVLEQAAHLDSTCATLDAQVGLTLLLPSQRAVSDVIGSAKAMGFIEQSGQLAWIGNHGLECFTLTLGDTEPLDESVAGVDRLTLLLDVPRSPPSKESFGYMLEMALELARRLGAEVVDDQGKTLAPGAEAAIDEQLQTLYAQLEAAGLAAGSDRARRVFA